MALDDKQLQQILDMFQNSGWNEMHLESGAVKLSISKSGRPTPPVRDASSATPQPSAVATPPGATAGTPTTAAPLATAPGTKPAAAPNTEPANPPDPNWVAVKAPLLGNFYVAPKPGAPPFVEVGQDIDAGDTLAILEVMKLMNHVKAEVGGKVARIVAENGNLVEFDEVLFYIDPT